ncbi:hypothetical protein F441_07764 [Phytophthora nicotianae CJ01A1]|uniref:Uncharacterized protein n=5 Tax=Phytophthora nicotianae TaxID=4792 RepID=W2QBU4_PHYN3|nr:hypothetical protein PPTG_22772 [Phytophthora nicotianae INRA-310]ETI48158.1 hypothetical protein F443_07782 [Phytophthora nicotianae P1569]ETK88069.1 hypothetical protein L915_07620 [Phytophthora nicotianae]ETO76979.1 hypothetical protein F444_07845 [Phytophthora nicotianae P1976]ETP17993.1 hypothetical protein F441_07764 [Phytophthora nicotianae CJ01A1]ETL41484.1 hypothetical protein L916_07552 [Phytophthora nicotianae]
MWSCRLCAWKRPRRLSGESKKTESPVGSSSHSRTIARRRLTSMRRLMPRLKTTFHSDSAWRTNRMRLRLVTTAAGCGSKSSAVESALASVVSVAACSQCLSLENRRCSSATQKSCSFHAAWSAASSNAGHTPRESRRRRTPRFMRR